ncbi:tetratricopeptide repeat protein [Thermincola potens]|uniref:TPR repeat-containing protein n=1 Tax=Thermincola potens (strain JR) TaxID=635013 RepID=D5X7X5_THEPJ|nr:tetratricopeptide repeat protein [Thermincola potens]ADG82695.1 TPR repeat-containing protein [Thermincola potens JR]
MSSVAPAQGFQQPSEKTFTLFQAIAIVLLAATVFIAAGFLIGKNFFWNNLDQDRINQQLAYFEAKVEAEPRVPENRVNLGYTYYLKKDYDMALKQFQIAVNLDPKYADAYYNMGLVYKDMKRYDDALEALAKSTKLAPLDYKNFMMMGIVYTDMGKYDEAFKALNKANQNRPGSADVLYYIGVAAEKSGDKEGAASMYKEALNYDPNFKDAQEALNRLK